MAAGESGSQADADVLFVVADRNPAGSWMFTVTVQHPDAGWSGAKT
jgi:hypothetical protein